MNGAICTLLSWQNTPILLLGRQKAANNNRRIWQFKRSIKATQRLTIKAASPFKDGSKDPFATLLFWRIELYKFRVKESCFSSLFGLGFSLKKENSNSVSIWLIYDERVCDVWVTVRRMQASEQWRGADTRKRNCRLLPRDCNGIPVREAFLRELVRIFLKRCQQSSWWCARGFPLCDATPPRPTACYLFKFPLHLVAEESVAGSNGLSPTSPLSNLSLSG